MGRDLTIGSLCTARVEPGAEGYVVVSPADPYVRRMDEEEGEDLLILAACALRRDPTCIEAHLILSDKSHDEPTRIQHLKVAVRAGDHLWGQVAAENGPLMCWKNPGMRPYLGAIQGLGNALAATGTMPQPSSATGASDHSDRTSRRCHPTSPPFWALH